MHLMKIEAKRMRRSKGATYMDVFMRTADEAGHLFVDRITVSHPKRKRDVAIGICKRDSLEQLASPDQTILVGFYESRISAYGTVDGRRTHILNPHFI
ncbi:hypothetical protein DY251_09380 [Mesorhizobium denitrificans]|uniref:Uncharacterized protein n=2 Tax=Mesorhizobium denitrificans TaxID=2294114 RepID=A0A371XFI9_9HYPH|nr:hypothetical protein DY251_09380 [Mesorhizobium denitrificans]